MWRNYWTVAVRALAKSKTYSIINIAGLAIGMAACILILLYVRYENSYDKWLPDAENTYQFQAWYPESQERRIRASARCPPTSPRTASRRISRRSSGSDTCSAATPVIMKDGQSSFGDDYGTTDDDFLKVVKLADAVRHDADRPRRLRSLSQSEAIRRFGTDQVLGRTLSTVSKGVTRDYKIVGVFKDIPKNSHMKLNAILRADFNCLFRRHSDLHDPVGLAVGLGLRRAEAGHRPQAAGSRLPAWEKRNIPDETEQRRSHQPGRRPGLALRQRPATSTSARRRTAR